MAKNFIKSIIGGVCISIGGLAYLSVSGGLAGAFLFSIGLVTILIFDYRLFTGKVCYVCGIKSALRALVILAGNLLGTILMGSAVAMMKPDLQTFAKEICAKKFAEGWSVIPLGMICNILIFFAVEYNIRQAYTDSINTIAVTILCVMVFILSGTEHSIANSFYMTVSENLFSVRAVKYLGANILGNAMGGILIYRFTKLANRGNYIYG